MPWQDFRAFVAEIHRRGHVLPVQGADCDLEIGALTELMCERQGPMLLFDAIPGYPTGYRIAAKPYSTPYRSAVALGLPEEATPLAMFKVWRERLRRYEPIGPVACASAPVLENAVEGAAVDLTRFPVPRWHEGDGGPYFGTGCAVITRDPDEDWVNLGAYRCMLHDERTAAVHIAAVHHGSQHLRKWWAQGKAAPIAVAVSPDPYLYLAAAETLPWGTSEYEFAGFLKGSPEEVFLGPRTGLPLPAHAELIVEGEVPPPTEEQRLEGPFGEYTGYYADVQIPRPVIRVQALYYRTNPILHGDPPLKPPVLTIACPPARTLLLVWDGLEKAGLPGIEGVYPLTAGGDFLLVVAIKQQYAGHAREVGLEASKLIPGSGRLIVVVDDDIDPSSSDEVLWAIATRTDPATTFDIQEDCSASMIDPMISPTRKKAGGIKGSRAVIVACRPWEWRDEFPPVNRNSDALRQRTLDKWQTLFDYERAGARDAQIQELLV